MIAYKAYLVDTIKVPQHLCHHDIKVEEVMPVRRSVQDDCHIFKLESRYPKRMSLPMVHLAEMASLGDDCYTAKGGYLGRAERRGHTACNVEYGIWITNHEGCARESEEVGVLVELTAGE